MRAPGILAVDRVIPAGTFTTPAAGNVTGVITVAIAPTDNDAVASVQFKIDGANIGSLVTTAPWQVSYDTRGVANGTHTYTAVITDRVGNTITITRAGVIHANVPIVTITSPTQSQTFGGNFNFYATVTHYGTSCSTQFKIDGANYGSAQAGSGGLGFGSIDSHLYTAGGHTFAVTATDAQGRATTASITATISQSVPGAGYVTFGDLMSWWSEYPDEGWYTMQTRSPSYAARWDSGLSPQDGASWWSNVGQGAGSYPYLYLPGNPDPTHYQMRLQFYGVQVEGGTDSNHVYYVFVINGTEVTFLDSWQGEPRTSGFWGLQNVSGGENIRVLRWATQPDYNYSRTRGVSAYYDFVLKGGFAS